MITDYEAERAQAYLRATAVKAGVARAERLWVEEYRKVVKAREMQKHKDESIGAQEREAYASEEYEKFLVVMREAIRIDEHYRFMREAAHAKISAWQTMNKNLRSAI